MHLDDFDGCRMAMGMTSMVSQLTSEGEDIRRSRRRKEYPGELREGGLGRLHIRNLWLRSFHVQDSG